MENELKSVKPKFRWGRLFLMILFAVVMMIIGYVGGNYLKDRLIKKLEELEEAERDAQAEEADYEEVEEQEQAEEADEKSPKIIGLVTELLDKAAEQPPKPKSATIGFKVPKKTTLKKK